MDPVLRVGARFACFACALRHARPGPCARCGRATRDLSEPDAPAALEHFARARAAASRKARRVSDGRSPAWTAFAHAIALAGAAWVAHFGYHLRTQGYVPHALVALLGAVLGLIAGYVVAAALPVVALVLAGTLLALVVLLTACVALPLTFALGRARGAVARAAIARTVALVVARTFAFFRGTTPRLFALSDAMPGLEPEPLAASIPTDAPLLGTVVLTDDAVALGDASGAVVGARGVTRGATVCDALVASPLVIETPDGERVTLAFDAGEVRFASRGALTLLDDAPIEWGVLPLPPTFERGALLPAEQPLELFVLPDGARVSLEGGAFEGEAPDRVLRGTAASPVRLTVMYPRAP